MRKKTKKKVNGIMVLLGCGMTLLMSGCGDISVGVSQESSTVVESQSESNANREESGQETSKTQHLDSLLGEWIRIVSMGEDYYYVTDDLEYSATLDIYEEDEKYRIDYFDNEYGYVELSGMELHEVSKPKFEGNDSAEWYAEYERRRVDNISYDIVKLSDDILKLHEHSTYTYENEETGETETYNDDYYYVYAKKDSPRIDDIFFQYCYRNTVTVSNIRELYEAIADHTRIILKGGVYNISELPLEDRNNPKLNMSYNYETNEYVEYPYDSIKVEYVNWLLLEGEEGADVKICTEDGYEVPIYFEGGNHITLKNLTIGHEVEPGTCSGAVVYLENSYNVEIKDCKLYGSGTYGIEADGAYNVNVDDSEIYECTYGLVSFWNSNNIEFKNCNLRDSSGFNMFYLYNTWGAAFENCNISNNVVEQMGYPFVYHENGDVLFRNCQFAGNQYETLKKGDVVFEGCSISDN